MKAERDIVVTNEHGLHARPAMQIVDAANRFESDLTLRRLDADGGAGAVDAKSVMSVITLAATRGTRLHLTGDGPDAQEAVDAIAALFEDNFGEGA